MNLGNLTENDLLKNFEEVQKQIEGLLQEYCDYFELKKRLTDEALPLVVEPVFSYEIHASS